MSFMIELMSMPIDNPNDDIIHMASVVRVVAKEDTTLFTQSGQNILGATEMVKGEVLYLSKARGVMITAQETSCTSVKIVRV